MTQLTGAQNERLLTGVSRQPTNGCITKKVQSSIGTDLPEAADRISGPASASCPPPEYHKTTQNHLNHIKELAGISGEGLMGAVPTAPIKMARVTVGLAYSIPHESASLTSENGQTYLYTKRAYKL